MEKTTDNTNNLEHSANSPELTLANDSTDAKNIEPTPTNNTTSMAGYIFETLDDDAIIKSGDLAAYEWLDNDLASYLSDEEKYLLQSSEGASIASNGGSPLLSSNIPTPHESPFESSTASFSGSPLLDCLPDTPFPDYTGIIEGAFPPSLIKMPSTTAAVTIPVSPQHTIPMATAASSAFTIPWESNINGMTMSPHDDNGTSFVSAILNSNTSSARISRPLSRSSSTNRRRTSKNMVSSPKTPRRSLQKALSIPAIDALSTATPDTPTPVNASSPIINQVSSPILDDTVTSSPYSAHSSTHSETSTTTNVTAYTARNSRKRSGDAQKDLREMAEELAIKRAKNTDAARRSRLRKVLKMESLEKEVTDLKSDNSELQTRVAVLESEKKGLEEKNAEKDARVRQLELQLSEAYQRLINKI